MSESAPQQSGDSGGPRNRLEKPWWAFVAVAALGAIGAGAIGAIPSVVAWVRSFFPINATLFLLVKEQNRPLSGVQFSVIDTRDNSRLRRTDAVGEVAVSSKEGLAHLSVRVMPGLGYVIEAIYASQGETFTTTIPVSIDGDIQQQIPFNRTEWYTAANAEYVSQPSTEAESTAGGRPPWMEIAVGELGQKETGTPPGNPRILEYLKVVHAPMNETVPWNSAFVNWVMEKAGFSNTGSLSARSWLNWGVPVNPPTPGCIAVFWSGSPTGSLGHVAFYYGDIDPGSMAVLGGNQNNEVSVARVSKSRLLGCRVPS